MTTPPAAASSQDADWDLIRTALNWIYCGQDDPEGLKLKVAAFEAINRLRNAPPVVAQKPDDGWNPIETVPKDRYVLLFDPSDQRWDGNIEVGKWFEYEDDQSMSCFWSCGGPNGGLELDQSSEPTKSRFTHWMELPAPPAIIQAAIDAINNAQKGNG